MRNSKWFRVRTRQDFCRPLMTACDVSCALWWGSSYGSGVSCGGRNSSGTDEVDTDAGPRGRLPTHRVHQDVVHFEELRRSAYLLPCFQTCQRASLSESLRSPAAASSSVMSAVAGLTLSTGRGHGALHLKHLSKVRRPRRVVQAFGFVRAARSSSFSNEQRIGMRSSMPECGSPIRAKRCGIVRT